MLAKQVSTHQNRWKAVILGTQLSAMRDPAAYSHPEFQHLLQELEAMGRQQFEQFLQELEKLRARKAPPSFDAEEQRIIDRIKTGGLSKADKQRFKILSERTTTEALSEEDAAVLMRLLKQHDAWTMERAELLVLLMERWNQSVEEVKQRIGLQEQSITIDG